LETAPQPLKVSIYQALILAEHITINGSTNFEVSSDNSTFGASTTITYTSATLNATPVYVRLKTGLSEATYNENISYSGGGVSSADFSCSGSVTSATTSKKILFDASSGQSLSSADWVVDADTYDAGWNSSGVCYTSGTEANAQRYPTPATPTSESDWDGGNSKWAYELFLLGYTIESLGPCQDITYGDGSNPQDLSNYDVFICNEPNVQFTTAEKTAIINFINAGGGLYMGADHGDTSTEICGANTEADRNCDGWNSTEVWNDLMSGDPFGIQFDNNNTNSPTTSNVISDAADPLLHGTYGNVASMSFNEGATMTINNANNASAKGVIFMTGTSLPATTNAMVTYASYGAGRVVGVGDSSPTGDATGDTNGETRYNNWVDADNGTIIMNATIWLAEGSTRLVVSPSSLTGFTYTEGAGPSSVQTFTLNGYGLVGSGNITVTGSSDYEVSTDGITYTSSVTYPYASGIITGQPNTVYVRLISGLSAGDYNSEYIAISGGSATAINITCSGTVTVASAPALTSSVSTLNGFSYVEASGPSANQTFTISGSNLTGTGNIAVTGTTNYEVSTDGTTFSSSVTYSYASGVITGQPNIVYVRLKSGLSAGSYNSENITISGGSATTINVACNGTVTSIPAGASNVIITEIVDASTYQASFVEIHNAGNVAQDITGWKLYENGSAIATVGSITLQPCDYMVFIRGTLANLESLYGTYSGAYYMASTSLIANGGDYFELKDAGAVVIDQAGQSGTTTSADKAYERIDAGSAGTSISSDWNLMSDRNLATPGQDNLQALSNDNCGSTCTPPSAPTTTGGTICGTGTVGLSASGAVAGEVYKWYSAASGGSALKTSTDESDNTYTTESVSFTTTYYVTRYITATSCESTPRTAVVATINQLPSITLDISPRVCSGTTAASLAYTATTDSPDQYSITWDAAAISAGFADVALTSLPATPINLTIPGSAPATLYNGTIHVKNSTTGCSGTGTGFTVLIIDPVTPAITNSITTGTNPSCAGSSVTFTASATNLGLGTPSYQWKNGTTNVGTNSSVYTTTGLSDSDDISCVLTVTGGCVTSSTATSNTVSMTINPLPATPSAGSNSAICSGSDLNLTSDATGIIAWTGPNSFSSAVQNPVISSATSAAGGTYSVTSTVGGCTSIAGTTEVTINTPVISGTLSVSIGGTTILSGTPAGGTWSSGTTSVATIDASGTVSGVAEGTSVITYSVGGCDATETVTVVTGPCSSEGFEVPGTSDPTGWSNSGAYYNSGSAYEGSYKAGLNSAGDWIQSNTLTSPASVKFWARASGSTSNFTVLLESTINGTDWITAGTFSANGSNSGSVTSTYSQLSATLTSSVIAVRWRMSATSSGSMYFDAVEFYCSTSPAIITDQTTLSPTYMVGFGPSAPLSYNLSASNLTPASGDITVTAPSSYEVCLTSGGTYTSSLTVPYTGSALSSTPVYMRLVSGLAVGTYGSVSITNAGGGATTVNVGCNGSVTPALSVSPSNLGFGEICTGSTLTNSFTITGDGLTTANVTVAAKSGYTYSTTSGGTYTTTLDLTQPGGSFSQVIYVKFSPSVSGAYNGDITVAGGGAANAANCTVSGTGVTTIGTVTAPSDASVLVNANPSFTVSVSSGTSLGYEWMVSTDGGTNWSTVTNGGVYSNATTATLNITLVPLSMNGYKYKCNISNTCTSVTSDAATLNVSNGPAITVTGTLSNFGALCMGEYSAPQTITVSGSDLLGNVIISSPSTKFQVSADNITYSGSVTLTPTGLTLASTTVYVRFYATGTASGTGAVSFTGTSGLSFSSTNASTVYKDLTATLYYLPSLSTPADQSVAEGANATFSITATAPTVPTGATIASYQWLQMEYNSSVWLEIAGATSNSLTLNSVSGAMDNFDYICIATSSTGCSDTSYSATLSVTPPLTPVTACGTEAFAAGTTMPSGWLYININGTSSTDFGAASPSLVMDATSDKIMTDVVTAPTSMSFWFKGLGTMTGSSLLVEGFNGFSWQTIENITTITTTGTTKTYNSVSAFSRFRYTFTKGGSSANLVFDDVSVTCGSETTAWLIDEKFDAVSSIATITSTNTPGFTASGTGTIAASTATVGYNRSANGLTFTGTAGSYVTITTPVFSGADMLSFWYRQPNVASTNPFVVEQYSSAKAGWTTLATIPGGAASSKPAVYFYPLDPSITQIRFTYTRTDVLYQGYLDDVRIRAASTCTSDIKILQTLVQSCGGGEGINESVIFKTGADPVRVSDLSVSFPNVGLGGTEYSMEADQKFVSNPAYITQLNDLVHLSYPACSPVMEPPSGIIPANSYAVIFTGKSPTVTYDFKDACISGTNYYVVFCDNTNTAGRYGNTPDAGELDYTAIIDKATGCYDSQFYDNGIPNTLGALASYDETTRIRTYTDYGCEIIILPVELESFEAKCQNDYVFISWATASEVNNDYFELQKSNDGVFWYNIAVIDGAGNSNNIHNYSFADKQYDSNKAYYRLKQVDTDGKFEYSNIIYSDCSANNSASVLIYPNPCSDKLNITVENWFSNSIKIEITDMPGQLIWSSNLESHDGFGIKQTDTESLKPGLYFIRLSDGNQSIVKKFVKQ